MCELSGTSLRPDASVLPMFVKYLLKEWAIVWKPNWEKTLI